MASFKVVGKNAISGLQTKKTVYKSQTDFNKHSPELINRWNRFWDVYVYKLTDNEKWLLISSHKSKCELKCEGCWKSIEQSKLCKD